jgi:DNA repair exonuclease SbcCD ATPase subunit
MPPQPTPQEEDLNAYMGQVIELLTLIGGAFTMQLQKDMGFVKNSGLLVSYLIKAKENGPSDVEKLRKALKAFISSTTPDIKDKLLKELRVEGKALKDQNEQLKIQVESLKDAVQDAEQKNTASNDKVKELDSHLTLLNEQYEKLKVVVRKMEKQLDTANAQVQELQLGLKVAETKCQERLHNQKVGIEGTHAMQMLAQRGHFETQALTVNEKHNLEIQQHQKDLQELKLQLQTEKQSCDNARARAGALEQALKVKSPRDCTAPEVLAQYEAYEKQLKDLKKQLDKCEKAKNQKQPGSPKASHKGDIEKTCGIMAVRDTVVDGLKHNIGLDENATDPVQKALYLLHKARKNDIGDRLLALLQLLLQLVKNLKADLPLDHTQVTSACAEMSLKLLQYEEVFGQATAETKEIQQMQAERKLSMSAVIKSIPGGRTWQPHR